MGRSLWAIRDEVLPRLIEAHRAGDHRALQRLALRATAAPARRAAHPGQPRRRRRRRDPADRRAHAALLVPVVPVRRRRRPVDFRDAFREALNSPDVGAIVLDVDSPGGLIDLVPETAAEIRDARGTKPIVAVANTMAASRRLLDRRAGRRARRHPERLGRLDRRLHGPRGLVGLQRAAGHQPTYISAGKYKTEGNPDEPLSDEARADWQQEVDDLYAMFVADVAAGRGVTAQQVRDGYGEGRTLLADRALAAGMVDRVDTIETVIGGCSSPAPPAAPPRAPGAPRRAATTRRGPRAARRRRDRGRRNRGGTRPLRQPHGPP
jgi:hypothetical protein